MLHSQGLEKFYDQVYQAILRLFHFDILKAIIIASPGFVRVRYDYHTCWKIMRINASRFRNNYTNIFLIRRWYVDSITELTVRIYT